MIPQLADERLGQRSDFGERLVDLDRECSGDPVEELRLLSSLASCPGEGGLTALVLRVGLEVS